MDVEFETTSFQTHQKMLFYFIIMSSQQVWIRESLFSVLFLCELFFGKIYSAILLLLKYFYLFSWGFPEFFLLSFLRGIFP